MADKSTDIAALLSPAVESLGLELLGVEYLPSPGGAVVRLYIDRPGGDGAGVGIDDCEAASREVSAVLDVEDPISGNYTLEVSSPGVDRPLFTLAHFERFLGEQAKVGLKLPQDGRRRLQGRIAAVGEGTVTFEVDGQPLTVVVDNIDKARLVPDWAALGFGPAKGARGRGAGQGKGKAGSPKNIDNKPAAQKPSRAE